MNISQQITVNASADKVWSIVGTDYANAKKWATRMLDSRSGDDLGSMGGRYVNTVEYGEATETLYQFDNEQRELAYTVNGNLPPVITDVTTGWRVEANGKNQSTVTTTFGAKMLNPEMEGMISQRLLQGLVPLLEELKHYAENDQPHPRKQEQLTAQQ